MDHNFYLALCCITYSGDSYISLHCYSTSLLLNHTSNCATANWHNSFYEKLLLVEALAKVISSAEASCWILPFITLFCGFFVSSVTKIHVLIDSAGRLSTLWAPSMLSSITQLPRTHLVTVIGLVWNCSLKMVLKGVCQIMILRSYY